MTYDSVPVIDGIDQISLSARTAGAQVKLSDFFLPISAEVEFRKVLLNNLVYVGSSTSERLAQLVSADSGLNDDIPTNAEFMDGWDYVPVPPAGGE